MARLEQALRQATFVPPPSTWQRVRYGIAHQGRAAGRGLAVAGVIVLCLLILATIVYFFNRVLADLLTGPV